MCGQIYDMLICDMFYILLQGIHKTTSLCQNKEEKQREKQRKRQENSTKATDIRRTQMGGY